MTDRSPLTPWSERALLACGVAAAVIYVGTDVLASAVYPGYSIRAQAVSELFAIGAPTASWVVPLLTLSSVLLIAFAVGMWRTAGNRRWLRALGVMFGGSAVVGLLIWNVFPMHMRGEPRSFTDTMHLVLATNPFVLLTLVVAVVAGRGGFRIYTLATVAIMLVPAIAAFSYADALAMDQSTPWLGAAERVAQYGYEAWQAALAFALLGPARRLGV